VQWYLVRYVSVTHHYHRVDLHSRSHRRILTVLRLMKACYLFFVYILRYYLIRLPAVLVVSITVEHLTTRKEVRGGLHFVKCGRARM